MVSDIYMIFLTAFAIFGIFSIMEDIVMYLSYRKSAKNVVIVFGGDNDATVYNTVQYLHNTLYNSYIIVVSEGNSLCEEARYMTKEELLKYIKNDLFTKN